MIHGRSAYWFRAWDEWQARLHRVTKTGPGPALLATLAAHLRCQPVGFAVDTVRGRGERVAAFVPLARAALSLLRQLAESLLEVALGMASLLKGAAEEGLYKRGVWTLVCGGQRQGKGRG